MDGLWYGDAYHGEHNIKTTTIRDGHHPIIAYDDPLTKNDLNNHKLSTSNCISLQSPIVTLLTDK
jgi:hypothetical protein